ncbi:hypothetical protein BP5796_02693 [Coleophoma crateriformis]|uniref:Peptidase A1 domain-containing protein n=1 Tax=Coleophoma crateriformis TaxID=565419 RepID=A0A3D8T0J4_9HELO|nr:hypothetical protein BP5796_02693 [Coleophoma crateriformis]
MLIVKAVATAVALCQVCTAFFPWEPTYRCLENNSCASKRGLESRVATPAEEVQEPRSFKIVQRIPKNDLSEELRVRRLAAQLAKKYARGTPGRPAKVERRDNNYSVMTASTPSQADSAGIDQDGTDYSYFTEVALGSKGTLMYMLLDTGAGTSWVMGPTCTSDSCVLHNSFGPADSTTYKSSTETFSVSYGSGSVSGTLATDSLTLAGLTFSMTLGNANLTSADFTAFPFDGILGLSMATGATPNFVQTLVSSKSLKSNLFGISINRAEDGTNTGEINFGAPDTSKFDGSLSYSAVSGAAGGDWAIPMDDMGLDGSLAGLTGKLAYIDTGTSYIFGPPTDVATFHKLITGSQTSDSITYSVPCTTTTTVEFVFNKVSYSVSAADWVGGSVGSGMCTSNIFGHAVVDGAWLLGDTFLKNVYSVFDIDGNRIGFAEKPSSSSTSTTATSASSTGGPTTSLSDSKSSTPELSSTSSPTSISKPLPKTQSSSSTIALTTTAKSKSNTQSAVSSSISGGSVASATTGGTAKSTTSAHSPALSGHETSAASGTVAAATSGSSSGGATATATSSKSDGHRLEACHGITVLVALVFLSILV